MNLYTSLSLQIKKKEEEEREKPKQETESLFGLFKKAGTQVSLYWQNSGHELRIEEVKRAKELLHSSFS